MSRLGPAGTGTSRPSLLGPSWGNIAMPQYKATWFFTSQKYAVGWSESWYTNANDPIVAQTNVANYLPKRIACLSDAALCQALRIARDGAPRDSTFMAFSTANVGLYPEATNPIAGVWDCLLCRRDVFDGSLLGHFFMRFVPAGIFNGRLYVEKTTSPATWESAFKAFGTEVTNGNYEIFKAATPIAGDFVAPFSFQGVRRTERKIGRPFDLLRGRRRAA